jgi:hypothetical protein
VLHADASHFYFFLLLQVEVPANTALVVCREQGGILNILLSPLTASGKHPRHEEVARCLEAVSHTRSFGSSAAGPQRAGTSQGGDGLLRARSQPSLTRPMSQSMLDGPTDSGDSGPQSPPLGGCGQYHGFGGSNGTRGGGPSGPLASIGEDDQLTGHLSSVMSLAAANGLLFSGSTDSTIKVSFTHYSQQRPSRLLGDPDKQS